MTTQMKTLMAVRMSQLLGFSLGVDDQPFDTSNHSQNSKMMKSEIELSWISRLLGFNL
jgi:hypothetical protein